jgi:hemolysin activation/secretion protein
MVLKDTNVDIDSFLSLTVPDTLTAQLKMTNKQKWHIAEKSQKSNGNNYGKKRGKINSSNTHIHLRLQQSNLSFSNIQTQASYHHLSSSTI